MKTTANIRLLLMSIICMGALSLTSCKEDKTVYLPVQTSEGGAWTFVNDKGERVGNQEWEFEPSISRGGIFTANTEDGLTVYRWDGDEAKPIDSLTNLVSVGVLNEGLLPVTPRMQRIRIVDAKGNLKFELEPIGGQEISSCADKFSEGLLVVTTTEGKSGVINTKGEVVVAPKYAEISNFNGGYALAADYNYDNPEDGPSYFIIDKEGKATKVKGQFGYEEGDCSYVPEFEDGEVYVAGKIDYDDENVEYHTMKITTSGEVSEVPSGTWVSALPGGGKIISTYDGDVSRYEWIDKEGKRVLKTDGEGQSLYSYGDFVVLQGDDTLTVYGSDGKELNKLTGRYYPLWSTENFGLVLGQNDEDYSSPTVYILLDMEGQVIPDAKYYGVGTNEAISLRNDMEDMCGYLNVTSAYVDVTAAASKLSSMIDSGVKGKSYYYLGESVADILSGENAGYYNGSGRNFNLPTDSTYYLANGAGFWITGTGRASADIVAPTYQKYFEVHHYDYWGRAWGWNRTRKVGVHFNSSAKVIAFDLTLRTNHPSGERLREALGRRLKNDGYTVTVDEPNYVEYTNGFRNVIIYGNKDTAGIGAIVYNKDSGYSKSDTEKAGLAAELLY